MGEECPLIVKPFSPEKQRKIEAMSREKAYRDHISEIAEAEEKGRAEERARVTNKLKAMGYSEDFINN